MSTTSTLTREQTDSVTAPAAPGSRSPQYPLGWLRGLAALCVVTFHAYQHNRTGPDSTWPWSQDVLTEHTEHLSAREKDWVLHDNVSELYGLEASGA